MRHQQQKAEFGDTILKEVNEMERKEDREKVLVPVRRRGPTQEEELQQELPKEPGEVKVPRMPRRWYAY